MKRTFPKKRSSSGKKCSGQMLSRNHLKLLQFIRFRTIIRWPVCVVSFSLAASERDKRGDRITEVKHCVVCGDPACQFSKT